MRVSLLGKILDLFFPRTCPMCGNRLVGDEETLCVVCNLHLPRTDTWQHPYGNEMAKMFWHLLPVERCGALFYYQSHSIPSILVYKLKYGNRPDIGVALGRLLADEGEWTGFYEGIDAIVPIPLTKERMKKRGYNQSEYIARGISERTGLPVWNDVVMRNTFTESQTHKSRWERQWNVDQVFSLCKPYLPDGDRNAALQGKHLLVVDDVCTTGATILACCTALKKAGDMRFSIVSIGLIQR